jgi:hypothetical protein
VATWGRFSRREFVRRATLGAAALTASPAGSLYAQTPLPDSARVFAVHHKDVCPIVDEYRPADPQIVKIMVREALLRMGIGKAVDEIVRRWCPSGKRPATARVKIKYAGTRGLFPAHPGVVNGVVRLLIDEGGIKPENIHVYENCPKNFGEDDRPPIFGTAFGGGKNREPGVVYSQLKSPDGVDMPNSNCRSDVRVDLGDGQFKEYTFWFWAALDKDTDILINVPVLKRHIGPPKFTTTTIAMKNHYGSIRDPYRQHGPEIGAKIAGVNMAKVLREKERLIVVDALYAMYSQGPERGKRKFGINKLLVTRDPVASDYVGWGMLNELETCAEPREIAIAARNGVGVRGQKWQDHVRDIEL